MFSKFTLLITALIAWAVLASAITPVVRRQSVPSCVGNCFVQAIAASSCGNNDFACLCKDSTFISSTLSCFQSSCDAADAVTGQQFGKSTCAAAGVDVSSESTSGSATAATTATSSSSSSKSTSSSSSSIIKSASTTSSSPSAKSTPSSSGANMIMPHTFMSCLIAMVIASRLFTLL